jgi:hypothetical protein
MKNIQRIESTKEIEECIQVLRELNLEIAVAEFKQTQSKELNRLYGSYTDEMMKHHHPLAYKIVYGSKNTKSKPQLQKLCLFADNLPVSWGKIVKTSAADYEDRINELWGAGKYRSAKWNQKLAWLCALSNLGHYLWLKAWKPVSTVFRRLL